MCMHARLADLVQYIDSLLWQVMSQSELSLELHTNLFEMKQLYFSFIERELDKKWWSEKVARSFEQSIFNEIHIANA